MNLKITAAVHWKSQAGEQFTKGKYSREHLWELETGTQIKASASVHIVPLPHSNPDNIDPEEAFVCSVASCHMLFFLSLAAKRKINVLEYHDAPIGVLEKNESGRMAITEIVLRPKVIASEEINKKILDEIHELAHHSCFIANSINAKIRIKPQ